MLLSMSSQTSAAAETRGDEPHGSPERFLPLSKGSFGGITQSGGSAWGSPQPLLPLMVSP